MSVQKATSADTTGILSCLSAAFEVYRNSYTPAAFVDTILTPETIKGRLQEMTIFVATEKSGEIVGTIACSIVNPEEGHIRGMAVLPASQGTGVAARLLAHAEAHFRGRNCKRISLDITLPLDGAFHFTKDAVSFRQARSGTFLACPCMNMSKLSQDSPRLDTISRV